MAFFWFSVAKMDGHGLVTQHIMNACQEDSGNAVLATEETPNSSNKTECFSCKVEWANA